MIGLIRDQEINNLTQENLKLKKYKTDYFIDPVALRTTKRYRFRARTNEEKQTWVWKQNFRNTTKQLILRKTNKNKGWDAQATSYKFRIAGPRVNKEVNLTVRSKMSVAREIEDLWQRNAVATGLGHRTGCGLNLLWKVLVTWLTA